MKKLNLSRKLTASIIILIVLSICLCITTFALTYSIITVENNMFKTGYVSINLNNGAPVVKDNELVFAPGMTVEKDFFIENAGTCSIFYKLYFKNVSGDLANKVIITISNSATPLYSGTAYELNEKVLAAEDILDIDERRDLTLSFTFPKDVGNEAMAKSLSFDLHAKAVQTKNNPDKLFD